MKIEALERGRRIHGRLKQLQEARDLWDHADHLYALASFLGMWGIEVKPDALPVPIARFKRECLDAIATEEAALRAEIAALRAELAPVPSLIVTGQQAVAEFQRLSRAIQVPPGAAR